MRNGLSGGSITKPINVTRVISRIGATTRPNKPVLIFVGVIGLTVLLSIDLNIVGLLPLPTLSNNELMFLFLRMLHKGPVPPRGRNIVRFTNFITLVILVMFIVFGSVREVVK